MAARCHGGVKHPRMSPPQWRTTMGNTQQAAMSRQATLTLHQATDWLTLETALHNASQHARQVNRLAPGVVPSAAHLKEVGTLSGPWADAPQRQRSPVGQVVFASAELRAIGLPVSNMNPKSEFIFSPNSLN